MRNEDTVLHILVHCDGGPKITIPLFSSVSRTLCFQSNFLYVCFHFIRRNASFNAWPSSLRRTWPYHLIPFAFARLLSFPPDKLVINRQNFALSWARPLVCFENTAASVIVVNSVNSKIVAAQVEFMWFVAGDQEVQPSWRYCECHWLLMVAERTDRPANQIWIRIFFKFSCCRSIYSV